MSRSSSVAASERPPGAGRRWRRAGLSLFAAGLSGPGCVAGDYGTLLARETCTPHARVVEVFALGAQVRTAGADAGATLGFRQAVWLLPCDPQEVAGTVRESWFHVPFPRAGALLTGSTSYGIEAEFTPEIRRLALGYVDQVATIAPAESATVSLYLDRQNPRTARFSMKSYSAHSSP